MTKDTTDPSKSEQPSGAEHDLLPELGLKLPVKPKPGETDHIDGTKATEFDGHQAPEGAPDKTFGPQDDTPAFLEKKEGPRN